MSEPSAETGSMLMVVAGPSGTGKKTVLDQVRAADKMLASSVSATTRSPRPDEQDGREYYFLSKQEFLDRVEAGDFVEYAEVHGNLYGTLKSELVRLRGTELDTVLELDVQGAVAVRELYPDAILIFIAPPRFEVLAERLARRGSEDARTVARRLDTARVELGRMDEFDYIVVNDKLDEAVADVKSIIRAERCRAKRRLSKLKIGDT